MSTTAHATAAPSASAILQNSCEKAGEILAKCRAENPTLPPDLILVEDAASLLRVTTNCARRWVLAGDLEGWRAGKRIWVSRAAALAMWRCLKATVDADDAQQVGVDANGGATTTRTTTTHRRASDSAVAQRRIDKQQERHERAMERHELATRKLAAAGAG